MNKKIIDLDELHLLGENIIGLSGGVVLMKELQEMNCVGNNGKVSDGYHTFDELYHHRALLFATIVNQSNLSWKSLKHHDNNDPMFEGMFIVGIETKFGQATYHYDLPYWDYFKCKELDKAPPYDGHTPDEAIERIFKHFNT